MKRYVLLLFNLSILNLEKYICSIFFKFIGRYPKLDKLMQTKDLLIEFATGSVLVFAIDLKSCYRTRLASYDKRSLLVGFYTVVLTRNKLSGRSTHCKEWVYKRVLNSVKHTFKLETELPSYVYFKYN